VTSSESNRSLWRPSRFGGRRLLWSSALAAACVAVALGAATASAVSAAAKASSPGFKNVTLQWWLSPQPAYQGVFEQAIGDFAREYPGSHVKLVNIDASGLVAKFKTASAAGVPPDLYDPPADATYAQLEQEHLLAPLGTYLKTGFPTIFKPVLDRLSFKGVPYAVPLDVNSLTIGYNKAIFSKLGLAIPRTQSVLMADAKKIKAAGYTPLAVPEKDAWPGGDLFFAELAYTDTKGTALAQAEAGSLPWTAAPFTKAAAALQNLISSGVFDNSLSLDFNDALTVFAQGQAAMFYPLGNFDTATIDQASNHQLSYGLFPMPPLRTGGAPTATGGPAIFVSIPAGSKNKAAAVAFLRILTDARTKRALVGNGFIPSSTVAKINNRSAIYKQMLQVQATARPRLLFEPAVNTALVNDVQAMFAGSKSPGGLISDLQSAQKSG
jgi:raffinose/stachyose/melibiose transport system substrate-binding protein